VLVIEDDQDVAMTINDVVEERGYRAICVPNGKAALSVLERTGGRWTLRRLNHCEPVPAASRIAGAA